MKLVLIFLVLFLPGAAAFAQNVPRLEPDPRALAFFRPPAQAAQSPQNGGYSWTDLAEISLWASAAGESAAGQTAGRPSFMEQIRSAAAELRLSPELPAAGRERAEYILGFTHHKFLKSYSLNQTRLDTLLASGRYNCVSSAALYIILCMSAGLEASGVLTRDHAFAAVQADGEMIDVETTNPYGFDPGSRREFHDQFGKLTGFAYVPARNYRDRAAITPIELVSLILSNRIADLESRGRFAEAVPLALDRAALLLGADYARAPAGNVAHNNTPAAAGQDTVTPFFEDPYRDMMNRIFNYGAFLLKSGREEDCLAWAASASPKYPNEGRWQEFILAAANNRLQKLLRAGQGAQAGAFLEGQKTALSPANYAMLNSLLVDTELLTAASRIRTGEEGDRIIAAIEQARNQNLLSRERAAELLTFAVQKTAAALSSPPGRNWLAAIEYVEKALARFGANRELEQALNNYRSNRAADFHNRFAAAWNQKNYEEAARIIREGLAEFPDNRQLLADQRLIRMH